MPEISGGNILLNPSEVFEHLKLAAGMKVADLGCGGAGHFVLPAARLVGNEGVVYAVDIMKSVLASVESKARTENLPNIQYVWSDLEVPGGTKIDEASLDADFLINTLFQVKLHGNVIKEAVRLIKPGGKLLAIDWKTTGAMFGPAQEKRISPEKIKEIVSRLNLKLIEEFEAGPYHWGLIFQKS